MAVVIYTVEQIAELLNVTKQTIYMYIRQGKLKAKKVGKQYIVTENNLRAFLE